MCCIAIPCVNVIECVYVGIPYHWGGGEPGYCIIYVCMNAAYVYRYMHIYIYIMVTIPP